MCSASMLVMAAVLAVLQGEPLGLAEAVDAAFSNHSALRAADLQVELAESRVAEARASRLPAVRLTETLTRGNNPVFVFGSLLEQARFGPQNFALPALNNPDSITNLRSSVSASLRVFDWRTTSARLAQADVQRTQATLRRSSSQQQILFETLRQYYDVILASSAVEVSEQAVTAAEADVARAKDRLEAGITVSSDLLAAQVQLAEFRLQHIRAQGNLRVARAALNLTIGSPVDARYELTSALSPRSFDVAPLSELVTRAIENRAELQAAASNTELARLDVDSRRSEYWPQVDVFANAGASTKAITGGSGDYAVGASVVFNIFDSGRGARLAQARIQQRVAENERERIRDQIEMEVLRARENHLVANEQLGVAEATLAQATEALRIVQDRYQEGLTTITEVLRAETALFRARLNALEARHNHYVSYAAVLLATGELNDVGLFTR